MGYVLLCPIAESVPRASRNVNLLEEVEAQKLAAGDFDDYSPPPIAESVRLPAFPTSSSTASPGFLAR